MTEERTGTQLGDQVRDEEADEEGIASPMRGDGSYLLRKIYAWALAWTATNAGESTVTVPREERIKRERKA
ncbi:hypothetical protein ADK58_01290 [Streptomyces sp. XY152]|nr:hypothetical protein ADK58_01290 [Streptomyces sp. XY152]